MAVTALIVSLIAVVVSLVAIWYTHRQTVAAETAVHDAHEPDIRLGVERTEHDTTNADLLVTHVKGPDLDVVEVEIVVPTPGTGEVIGFGGVPTRVPIPCFFEGAPHNRVRAIDGLRQGETKRLRVLINTVSPTDDGVFRLQCRVGREKWTISRRVTPTWQPPGPPRPKRTLMGEAIDRAERPKSI